MTDEHGTRNGWPERRSATAAKLRVGGRGDGQAADPPPHFALALACGLNAWRSETADAVAISCFRHAAAQGSGTAAYFLSVAYAEGRGVRRNATFAYRWLRRAADLGNAEAEYFIGLGFTNGEDAKTANPAAPVERRNDAWAARWYGKAANQGDAAAQYMLGLSYALGLGLPEDAVTAYKWLWLAARAEYPPAETAFKALGPRIGPKGRALAIARARAWREPRRDVFTDGPTVRFVQVVLSRLGFDPGQIDGRFGPETGRSIAAYETSLGEDAAGRITPALLKRLEAVASEPAEKVKPHYEGVW